MGHSRKVRSRLCTQPLLRKRREMTEQAALPRSVPITLTPAQWAKALEAFPSETEVPAEMGEHERMRKPLLSSGKSELILFF